MTSLGNHAQGTLDGLCGIYAIVNSLSVGCGRGQQEMIFETASAALSKSRWPNVLWDGTSLRDMQRMIKSCVDAPDFVGVRVSYPFVRNTPRSNGEYWERFDRIFEDDSVRCAIMGINDPWKHWIVAGWDGAHVQFLDSTPGKEFRRKRRSSLFAGDRKQKPEQWRLDRQELIVFEVTE